MGLFGKLKNILFEDDDEVEEMPVYTKEEIVEEEEEIKVEPITQKVETVSEPSRFRNVKRDIDISFDDEDEDVLGEIPGAFESAPVKETVPVQEEVPEVKEEKKSIFPSFDEDEFDRLNAHLTRNEEKVQQREVPKRVEAPVDANPARQANNHFSSTNVNNQRNYDRTKINSGTIVNGKKPFTPSPVISPVYGILDKNYTKDDIVDRKGGLKRERSVKLPIKKEKTIEEAEKEAEENVVSIDSVREKAYGEIELPKREESKPLEKTTKPSEEVYSEVEDVEEVVPEVIVPKEEKVLDKRPSIEEQIEEEHFEVPSDPVDSVIDEVVPEAKAEKVEKKKMKVLDDMEKTSTLKILDDIEKELNSIKPISDEADEAENADIKEHEVTMDDTLENDLFNLIDSMYDEGEEEDD